MTTTTTKKRLARLQAGRLARLRDEGRASREAQFGDMSDDELEAFCMDGRTAEQHAIDDAIFDYLTDDECDILCAPSVRPSDVPRVTPLMWKHLGGKLPLSAREKRILRVLKVSDSLS